MTRLFLRPPPTSDDEGRGAAGTGAGFPVSSEDSVGAPPLQFLLEELESIIRSAIASGGRHEARLWLCSTISCIHSIDSRDQRDLFLDLLCSAPSRRDVAPRLLQMIFDERPEKAGLILAKRCYMLEKFFDGSPKRILLWFDNFAGSSEAGHRKGARAISRYAFANRVYCWEELEWKGRHGQSPAVVATKPHYFQELDVLRTVENFLDYVPNFWTSDELAESVKDGEILQIDTKYFSDRFMELMYEENAKDIWEVIKEFVLEETFSSLSQKLLVLLDENRLLAFIESIGKYISSNHQCDEFVYPSCWLENLLSKSNVEVSLDELFLLNAVIAQSRQLLRLINDDELEEEKQKIERLSEAVKSVGDADHWILMGKCRKLNHLAALKWAGLHSWIIFYSLPKECKTAESWKSLFVSNRINFRRTGDYSLIKDVEFIGDCNSESDAEMQTSSTKKKRKSGMKKRRKTYHHCSSSSDRLEENEVNGSGDFLSGNSWLLSTDGFSSPWNVADLPDYLSMHSFKIWMKWIYSKY